LKDARQRQEGSVLGRLFLEPVKLKSLVLGVGLAVMGMTGSAWAGKFCKNVQSWGAVRDGGTYCLSKDYPYTRNSKCKCPNPDYNSDKTSKCLLKAIPETIYHCENP